MYITSKYIVSIYIFRNNKIFSNATINVNIINKFKLNERHNWAIIFFAFQFILFTSYTNK